MYKKGEWKNAYKRKMGVEKCKNRAISGEKYCRSHIKKWQTKEENIIKDIMEEYGVCKDLGNEVVKYLHYTENL